MPQKRRIPKYRHHKPTGQAVVTLSGRDHYLGTHDTPESRERYGRLIAEWSAHGYRLPSGDRDNNDGELTIVELIAAHWQFAATYYRKGDRPTQELSAIRDTFRPLRKLYATLPVRRFGPLKLKAVRQEMTATGLCRGTVNGRIGRIKRVFRWAAANELVPAELYHGLQAVEGLKRGRTEARESEPVRPVPDEHVDAVLNHVPATVAAMIELQRLTGMRSGEVTIMRGADLDMTGKLWTFTPERHKTEHHGHVRVVYLGPQAQTSSGPISRPT